MKRTVLFLALIACRDGRLVSVDPFDAGLHAEQEVPLLPLPEVCNKKDDDFDGVVDNNISTSFCYTGPVGTLTFGECRPGVTRCTSVGTVCFGERGPAPELCDGLDNDCDGMIDEGMEPRIDVVFIIDNSGSMTGVIQNIRAATTGIMEDYENTGTVKFAVVGAPATFTVNTSTAPPRLDYNLGPADGGVEVIARQDGQSGSGLEPTVDAIAMVDNGEMGLNWTPGNSRLIVLFSDEPPQLLSDRAWAKPSVTTITFTDFNQANFSLFGDQFQFDTAIRMKEIMGEYIRAEACK